MSSGDGSPGREILFELDEPTKLLNEIRKMHFHVYRRYRQGLAWKIKLACRGQAALASPFKRARVLIERHSIGTPDRDGLYGGVKPLVDCLLPLSDRHPSGLGLVIDDAPGVMELLVSPVKARSRADQKTIVTITEINDAA